MAPTLKIVFMAVAIVLISILIRIPHPFIGILLVLDLAGLIVALSLDQHWTHIEFFLTSIAVMNLFFVLIALNAPGSISTVILAIVLGLALLAGIVLLVFRGPSEEYEERQEEPKTIIVPMEQASPQKVEQDGPFAALETSNVFHEPSCMTMIRSKGRNRQSFPTKDAAIKAGLKPCRVCVH